MVFIWGFWPPAVTSSSLSPSRRLRKQYTSTGATANPLPKGPWGPGFSAKSRTTALQQPSAVVLLPCVLHHCPDSARPNQRVGGEAATPGG
ncbi:hypothetical protein ARTSIC4J27_4548 [Pseudarthrobacter siccitolerans]|uniref:Uncharacterized protein n=1 Tax=Pseudarthrobacter siccitolerans TaxID=861266 RepID=A0A024H9G0_9MICC|nr:hypothetical protein ARTSIC4J27_4548 [Pseudarthrobacter siccitolerans]